MAYINNGKFNEILEASRHGDERAAGIVQGMYRGMSQDDIDGLVTAYYEPEAEPEQVIEGNASAPVETAEDATAPVEEDVDAGTTDVYSVMNAKLDEILSILKSSPSESKIEPNKGMTITVSPQ